MVTNDWCISGMWHCKLTTIFIVSFMNKTCLQNFGSDIQKIKKSMRSKSRFKIHDFGFSLEYHEESWVGLSNVRTCILCSESEV